MKKKVFLKSLAASFVLLGFVSVKVKADIPASADSVQIQRSFVNLDFQDVIFSALNQQVSQDKVPGWLTTHRVMDNNRGRIIEIWKGAGHSSTTPLKADSNDQYAELNAEEDAALYQKVCLFGGERFSWSLDHSGRQKNIDETMEFLIGKVNENSGSNAKYTYSSIQSITKNTFRLTDQTTIANNNRWATLSGTTQVSSQIPSNGEVVSFIFKAYNGSTLGNFLDNIVLKLKPAVGFSAKSGDYYEGNDGTVGAKKSIPFNIVGRITSQKEMPTLTFNIKYPGGYDKAKAIYNKNYRLYKRTSTGEIVPLTLAEDKLNTSDPDNITFNYTPTYYSDLDYSRGVTVDGLMIEVLGNVQENDDIIIPLSFALDKDSDAVATSLQECGSTEPKVNFDLVIKEDDVDLEVIKKLSLDTVPVKDQLTSYTLDVSNKSMVSAEGIVLNDIFEGLQQITTGNNQTSLSCKLVSLDGKEKEGTCPSTWNMGTIGANALLNANGLDLGTLPANSTYRFTLSNLKVIDPKNSGRVKNTASIKTVTMTDINLNNNESSVESWVAYQSDLFNHVSGSLDDTGVGLFYIAEGGRTGTVPLLTQATDNTGQVYFPLKIENKAPYSQDYKLYASKTAISALSTGEYSGLDASSISSYTSGLDIKFYLAEQGQCKAGLTANVVSQISLNANSIAEVCAQITASDLAVARNPIWFAIESLQTGLGDIIKNEVTYQLPILRRLTLVNDQQAQLNIGGTYVFSHRLNNEGSITENNLQFTLEPLSPNDDFSYSLFLDHNNNGVLDTGDEQVNISTVIPSVAAGERLNVLVKVQAPTTATNGMRSQVQIIVTPISDVNDILLDTLTNTDTVVVGSDQLVLQKTQFKQTGCLDMSKAQVQTANYSLGQMSIGRNDCIIYRIEASNIGAEKLTSIVINDMYPHYSKQWLSNGTLPMTDSGDTVTQQSDKVETKISQLLPGEKKSLYFGIKLQ